MRRPRLQLALHHANLGFRFGFAIFVSCIIRAETNYRLHANERRSRETSAS
jgi:hypothetical protein